ncbi:hypothetical protein GQF42_15975 [Streptomyces broussonetiae]|uniref:Uncharacterized protein n=1 Tax=Streptomyces broussonetiae TaxID=2686304 RepID=A0A6I6MV53_9ACTN|nr:hypothetical protein [Streptomyces broussonetiae]QHA04588.1 hypothetical protein GQF42_15975 [Streptomyces broussonetiae]
MDEQLFTVTAFSNAPEHTPTQGVVYIVTDATQEQVDALKAREAEQNPTYWIRVEAQG